MSALPPFIRQHIFVVTSLIERLPIHTVGLFLKNSSRYLTPPISYNEKFRKLRNNIELWNSLYSPFITSANFFTHIVSNAIDFLKRTTPFPLLVYLKKQDFFYIQIHEILSLGNIK